MEALHPGSGLDAQKENLDANLGGGALGSKGGMLKPSDTPSAKRAAFTVHSDVKPSRKGLKESAKKNRRVLGDISNRHVNRHENAGGSEAASAKKKSGGLQVRTPLRKKKKTPVKATPVIAAPVTAASMTATPTTSTRPEDVEEVEAAYGGLASPLSASQHMKSIREDIARELRNNKTPSFFDDLDFPDPLGAWDGKEEREMLETGASPSEWWAPPSPLHPQETAVDMAEYDDVPPPEDFAVDPLDSFDDDALDLALRADLDAATSE